MIEGLKISIPRRMILIRTTLILSLITFVFLSLNLWAGHREFPYTPIVTLNFISPLYDFIFIALVILFWLCSLFLKRQRLFIFLSFTISVSLVLLDINRLQPWFYTHSSLLVIFIFYNGRVDDANKFTSIFIILQLIFASVYFYTGINQLNASFVDTVYTETIYPLKSIMSERQFLFFKKIGVISPYALLFIGLGLIISPLRYLAIILAIFIHILLLIFLFPSSKNTNYACWFSNVTSIILLILLFSGKTKQRYFSPTFLFKKPLFYTITAIFLIMPAFNYTTLWPDYLSSNFKTGNNNFATITLTKSVKDKLPAHLKYLCVERDSFIVFDYQTWCAHELNSYCYPDSLVFKTIQQRLIYLTQGDVKDIQLELRRKQNLLLKP
jgi:hypothetical protein